MLKIPFAVVVFFLSKYISSFELVLNC